MHKIWCLFGNYPFATCRHIPTPLENIASTGEIAWNEHFFYFPRHFLIFPTNLWRFSNFLPSIHTTWGLFGYLPFSLCRHILTHLQQMTLENIVAKGEIAENVQFLLFPQHFHIYTTIILTFIKIFQLFEWMFSKASVA